MATGSSPSRTQRHVAGTLSDSDLLALLRREEEAAAGYQDSAMSALRQEALAYYDRQPFGIEHTEATPPASVDPALLAAQVQIAIQREAAQADIEIKHDNAQADMAIAAFKARQWAEIERFKAGLAASS